MTWKWVLGLFTQPHFYGHLDQSRGGPPMFSRAVDQPMGGMVKTPTVFNTTINIKLS